ncbi:MAG TPA: hypothetical protein VI030_03330 [Propionibacteriaceae bacterium]
MVGGAKSVGVLISGVVGLTVTLAGAWWFLSERGSHPPAAAAVALATPVFVIVLYISRQSLWAVLLAVVLIAISVAAGRAAIMRARPSAGIPERRTPPPHRPFVIMNPRSGGGEGGRSASSH